jgi:hypothetical protein
MKSPYLGNEHRLADILAAIQVMGTHLWDSRPIDHWQPNLGEKPQSAKSWDELFLEHPEFFGEAQWDDKKIYFLRLRRAYEKTIDPNSLKELTDAEIEELKSSEKYNSRKLSRRPLTPQQTESLIKAAIELQVRAGALDDRKRWWLPLLSAGLGFLGALAGSLVKLLA